MSTSNTLYRQPRWAVYLLLIPSGVLGVLFGIGWMVFAERVPRPLGAVAAAWFAWTMIVRPPSAGVTLTDSEVVNRGHVKTTRVRIADITDVTMKEPQGRIVLHLIGDRRVRLTGAPMTGRDRQRCYDELGKAVGDARRGNAPGGGA